MKQPDPKKNNQYKPKKIDEVDLITLLVAIREKSQTDAKLVAAIDQYDRDANLRLNIDNVVVESLNGFLFRPMITKTISILNFSNGDPARALAKELERIYIFTFEHEVFQYGT